MTSTKTVDQIAGINAVAEESKRLADATIASVRDLGTRARAYLATSALVITVAGAVNSTAFTTHGLTDLTIGIAVAGLGLGLALFVLCITLAVFVDSPTDISVTGELDILRAEAENPANAAWEYSDWLYKARMLAARENLALVSRRADLVRFELFALLAEVLVVSTTLLVVFIREA